MGSYSYRLCIATILAPLTATAGLKISRGSKSTWLKRTDGYQVKGLGGNAYPGQWKSHIPCLRKTKRRTLRGKTERVASRPECPKKRSLEPSHWRKMDLGVVQKKSPRCKSALSAPVWLRQPVSKRITEQGKKQPAQRGQSGRKNQTQLDESPGF
jgi:hypothetical protein